MLTSKMKTLLDWLLEKRLQTDDPVYIDFPALNIPTIPNHDIKPVIKQLELEGYIKFKPYTDGGGYATLTAKGIDYDELELQSSHLITNQTNIFNAPVTNSAIGNTGTITVNNGLAIQDALSFIQSLDISQTDKDEAEKVISYIETLAENDAPIKKGALAKFGEILSKHSWLPELVGKLIFTYLTGGSL